MRIHLTSVLVDDQEKAETFYTGVLGFVKKHDIPMGEDRWLTVVSAEDPEGTELLLEPNGHPAAKPFKDALVAAGIPFTEFAVNDVHAEFERLRSVDGRFADEPTTGAVSTAMLGDSRESLIQVVSPAISTSTTDNLRPIAFMHAIGKSVNSGSCPSR